MIINVLEIGLTISILCNCYALYLLDRESRFCGRLRRRIELIESIIREGNFIGGKDETGISSMAEDTKVAE